MILECGGIKHLLGIRIHQEQDLLNLNPLQTTGPTSLIPQIGLVAFFRIQIRLESQVLSRDRRIKTHTHELGIALQVKLAMNLAIYRRLLQQNRHATRNLGFAEGDFLQMLIRRHKDLLSGFTLLTLHLHIIASNLHQVVISARPCGFRDHGHVERNADGTFGFGQSDVRIDTNGTSNDLIVTSGAPVRFHQMNMANIGQCDTLRSRRGSHDDAQPLGLGSDGFLQGGRKVVGLDSVEDLTNPLLFRAVLFTGVESLRRTVVHRRIFTPDTPLIQETIALKAVGFQNGRKDA